MSGNLRFRHHLRVENLGSEAVVLVSERGAFFLNKPIEQLVASLVNKGLSEDEIVDAVLEQFPSQASTPAELLNEVMQVSASVYQTLAIMKREGYLIEGSSPLPAQLTVLCEFLQIDLEKARQRLDSTRVAISTVGLDSAIEAAFVESLKSMHINVVRMEQGLKEASSQFPDELTGEANCLEIVETLG